ncbi:hypothetical protein C1S82_01105 [Mycolicibacterium cosmeticum]|nr:hypothetical protein C1S82_01105 [Mycolicibacterium cosmeticum]
MGKPIWFETGNVNRNWLSRLASKYHRSGPSNRVRPGGDPDARRVRNELDAIRARFPDHA